MFKNCHLFVSREDLGSEAQEYVELIWHTKLNRDLCKDSNMKDGSAYSNSHEMLVFKSSRQFGEFDEAQP